MNKNINYLEQSKSMICGILLDVNYFIVNNKEVNPDEIQKYIKIIETYLRLLNETHADSDIFLVLYTGTCELIQWNEMMDLSAEMIRVIKSLLSHKTITNVPNLSSAMSLSLTRINKKYLSSPKIQKKLLIISTPFEYSPKFIPLMNCLFGAQKIKITIDCVVLSENNSHCTFCQQACHLTKGIYNIASLESLLPRLLGNNITDCHYENVLKVTGNNDYSINWKLWCFHCQKPLEYGYVCSSCLAVFCEKQECCLVCGVKFDKTE